MDHLSRGHNSGTRRKRVIFIILEKLSTRERRKIAPSLEGK
jgi:hypothetical protein